MLKRLLIHRPAFFMLLAGEPDDCRQYHYKQDSPLGVTYLSGYTEQKKASDYELILTEARRHSLQLYGVGWENTPWKDMWKGKWNGTESDLYGQSQITLGITVASQKELGMVNNRIFDSLACGTPIISDYFPALEEIFGDLVTYARKTGDVDTQIQSILQRSPQERKDFSERAISFIENQHTYLHRIDQVLKVFRIIHSNKFPF